MERTTIELLSGTTLHRLDDGEGRVYGHFELLPGGMARVWRQTWMDEYRPTDTILPGPISAMRAIRTGAV